MNGMKLKKAKGYVVVDTDCIEAIETYDNNTVVIMRSGDKHLVVANAEKLIARVFEDNSKAAGAGQ